MTGLSDLDTPRLVLRGATAGDLDTLRTLWNQPAVRRFLFDDAPVDMEQARAVLDACLEQTRHELGLWLAFEKTTGHLAGCAALLPTGVAAEYEPRLAGSIEPTIALDPARWHRGFAAESLDAILRHAFQTVGRDSVAAVNDVPNTASAAMLNRAGFVSLSEVDGPKYRIRTYTLTAQDWRRRHGDAPPAGR